jgi:hypothetical protein
MFVQDIATLLWDIMRLAPHQGRDHQQCLPSGAEDYSVANPVHPFLALRAGTDGLDYDWLFSRESKDRVSSLLQGAGLNEFAVEAEAFRMMIDDIEKVDRALAFAEARRDKSIRTIAECKQGLSARDPAKRRTRIGHRQRTQPSIDVYGELIMASERQIAANPTQCAEEHWTAISFRKKAVRPERAAPWTGQARIYR